MARHKKDITDAQCGWLPRSRSCFVCGRDNPRGMQVRSRIENGIVVLHYTPSDTDLGWKAIVHGGITMTLLDEVMTWSAIVALRRACVAAEITCRLLQPVRAGVPLRVEGEVVRAGGRLVLTEGRVLSPEGRQLAAGSGKYLPMAENAFRLCAEDFTEDEDAIPLDRILGS